MPNKETVTFEGKTANLNKAFLAVTAGAAAVGVALKGMVTHYARVQDATVGLRKVLKGTADEQKKVVKAVSDLANKMPVARTELLRMAAAGAQMGVADKDIKSFTQSMVKLAATTDITEGLTLSFGRLQKFTGLTFETLSSGFSCSWK